MGQAALSSTALLIGLMYVLHSRCNWRRRSLLHVHRDELSGDMQTNFLVLSKGTDRVSLDTSGSLVGPIMVGEVPEPGPDMYTIH